MNMELILTDVELGIETKDKENNFVVIELKKGRKNDEVIGQVLRLPCFCRSGYPA